MVSVTPISCAMICWVRSAIFTALSLGSAIVSSIELVCSDCVPPSTAASASKAVRTMLFSGCLSHSEQPGGLGVEAHQPRLLLLAPKRSRMWRAQMRRAARSLAISSKKSRWLFQKKLKPRREVVDVEPALRCTPRRR